jgi:hypothetical protein
VTHIRLSETNACKLAALDALAPVYLALCQEYVTYFCTEEAPDKFHDPVFATPLSERWHRVAIQQAAGIARSWRTNREQAYQSYLEEMEGSLKKLADYHRAALQDKTINSSVTLNRRADGWWLTLSYDEKVAVQTEPDAQVIGVDVGIANFLTSKEGRGEVALDQEQERATLNQACTPADQSGGQRLPG